MIRLAVLGFMYDLSYFISIPLGAWLFSFGYVQVFGTSMALYVLSCIIGLARLWNFKEKKSKEYLTFKGKFKVFDSSFCLNAIVDLISPKNVTDSLQATFQMRPDRKHVYQQCMMMVMLVSMMAGMGEGYCEFMYTKRLFQWKVETYSYFNLIKARNSYIASPICIFQLANISEFSCECWYIYFNANISLLQSQ